MKIIFNTNDDDETKSNNFFNMIEEQLKTVNNKIKCAKSMDNLFDDLNFISGNESTLEDEMSNDDDNIGSTDLRKHIFPELDFDNIPEEDKFTADNKYMYVCLENYPVNYFLWKN